MQVKQILRPELLYPGKARRKRSILPLFAGNFRRIPISALFILCSEPNANPELHTRGRCSLRSNLISKAGGGRADRLSSCGGRNLQAPAAGKSAWSHPGQVCQEAGACKCVALPDTGRSITKEKSKLARVLPSVKYCLIGDL